MAYAVVIKASDLGLNRKDVEFPVRRGNFGKVGTLKVSKGGVEWVPRDHEYGIRLNWDDFGKLMQEQGKE